MVKQSLKKTLCGILALAIFLVGVPSLILTAGAEADNYIKNPSFEDTDGGTVPDYSPNEWTVSSGWFVNTDPSAQEGNNALVAIQNGLATQTVTLPDGEYDFSGYMNAAGTDITIKITLTSGDNEKSVSLASGSAAGYQSISSFTVTGGSVTVKLESTFVTAFTSGAAVIDDLKLAKASSNAVRNPSFEDTDGGAVPDYSPNEWTVSSGWYINTDPSAQDGTKVMVSIQNGLATQTISLPDGEYNFSGYMNASGTDITIKITLSSGDNEKSISLKSGDAAGYQSINRFAVTGGSVTIKLESAFVTAFTSGAAVIDDLKLVKVSPNVVRNPSFEDTDGGAVPDYSPNEWVVSSGWYINTDPSAQDGTKVMVSVQNGLATQTISLPDGEYNFSGYMNAAGTDIDIKITLSSGDNEKSISLKSSDAAGYQSINRFAVTGGSVTIKLESAFVTPFTSGAAVIDDLKLIDSSAEALPEVEITFDANGGKGIMNPQKVEQGVATPLKDNVFKYGKHAFVGWNTQADGTGTAYTDKQSVTLTEALTLYAQWQAVTVPGPATEDFIPDDLTTDAANRTTYKDNELNWYADELLWNGSSLLDGSRVFDYVASPTDDWQKMENNFVRKDTDDLYAVSLMYKVGHPLADREYDIVYKDLQVPVKGGKLSYYLWFRNGMPMNHDVFATAAIVYDKDGKAYNLGVSDVLTWSGDERYFTAPEDPNVANMSGWHHYEAVMPKDVEIVKIGIMLTKTVPTSDAVIGPSFVDTEGKYGTAGATYWPGEDWIPVDEISIIDTVICDDNVMFDDETQWTSDDITINELGEYLNPWCMFDDKAIELDCSFNALGVENVNTITREFKQGLQGGTFFFKLYNATNSNVAGEARYKVSVVAYDKDGNAIDLGDCTPALEGTDFLKYSGAPAIGYTYNGYNHCEVTLPADKVITRLDIRISETTDTSVVSAIFMLDDVKFIDTAIVALEDGEQKPDDDEKPGDDVKPADDEKPDSPDTGAATALPVFAACLAVSALVLCLTKGKNKYEMC